MLEFYHNWLFYGTFFGLFGTGITLYIYGKIKGAEKLNWKVNFTVASIFMFPTIVLPFLLAPMMTLWWKIAVLVATLVFVVLKYYMQTKAQESIAEWRESKKIQENEKD